MRPGGDMVAAHYRISQNGQGQKVLVLLSTSEALLDKDLSFVEVDESGDKVCSIICYFVTN
jgi:transcription antitermination factor NusA-like protein